MKKRLGRIETQFFAYIQMRKIRIVEAGKTLEPLGLTKTQEIELFRRLTRGRLIARVRPGLYLVPDRLPLGGAWTPDEIQALNALIQDKNGKYQICGLNAFNRYGYDEQIPNRIYAYNDKISGDREIGSIQLTLIKVSSNRLGGTVPVKSSSGETGEFPMRERALLDAVYDWARFNTLPRAYNWVRSDLKKKLIDPMQLVNVILKYGDVSTRRRFGYLLEQEQFEERFLKKIERSFEKSSGYIQWIPGRPKRGIINSRWGIVDNTQSLTKK